MKLLELREALLLKTSGDAQGEDFSGKENIFQKNAFNQNLLLMTCRHRKVFWRKLSFSYLTSKTDVTKCTIYGIAVGKAKV